MVSGLGIQIHITSLRFIKSDLTRTRLINQIGTSPNIMDIETVAVIALMDKVRLDVYCKG